MYFLFLIFLRAMHDNKLALQNRVLSRFFMKEAVGIFYVLYQKEYQIVISVF